MIKPIFFFSLLFLCVSLSVSPQYKKHRLSLGHTNNYAKSVVNMADMVRSLSILSLKRLPQALWALSPSTHFSLNQPPILHLKHFLGHGMLCAAIKQSVSRGGGLHVGETVTALQQNWGSLLWCLTSGSPVMALGCWNLTLTQVIAARWERLCFWKWPCARRCGSLCLESAHYFACWFRGCVAHCALGPQCRPDTLPYKTKQSNNETKQNKKTKTFCFVVIIHLNLEE